MVLSMRRAPWPDFAGNPIHEGDTIRHPHSGESGVVVFLPMYSDPGDAWRVNYGDQYESRLCLQIGDKGQAIVIPTPDLPTPKGTTVPIDKQLPAYKSHKTVWALKIAAIHLLPNPDTTGNSAASSYGAIITPAEPGYEPFEVDATYMIRQSPKEGGYYVQYQDGYKSFSPAQAFEEGYTLVNQLAST